MGDNWIFDAAGQIIASSDISLQKYINGTNTVLLTGQLTVTAQHATFKIPGSGQVFDMYFLAAAFGLSPAAMNVNTDTERGLYIRQYKIDISPMTPALASGSHVMGSWPQTENNLSTVTVGTTISGGVSVTEGPAAGISWENSTSYSVLDVTLQNSSSDTQAEWTFQLPWITADSGFVDSKLTAPRPLSISRYEPAVTALFKATQRQNNRFYWQTTLDVMFADTLLTPTVGLDPFHASATTKNTTIEASQVFTYFIELPTT